MDRRTLLTLPALAAVGLALDGCAPKPDPDPDPTTRPLDRGLDAHLAIEDVKLPKPSGAPVAWPFVGFEDRVNGRLFRDQNTAWSPLSVAWALSVVAAGAKGSTASELAKALGATREKAEAPLIEIVRWLAAAGPISLASSMIVQQGWTVTDTFRQDASALGTPLGTVDIQGHKAETANALNAWVSDHTRGRITDLVAPSSIDALTRMILVNAIALKDGWDSSFHDAGSRYFHLANDDLITVPFAAGSTSVIYDKTDLWEGVAVPMKNPELFCVMAMLNKKEPTPLPWTPSPTASSSASPSASPSPTRTPTTHATPTPTAHSTPTGSAGLASIPMAELVALACDPRASKTQLTFPTWRRTTTVDVRPILEALGVHRLFSPSDADLTGIRVPASKDENLFVQTVAHQTFIAITAEGVEAEAGTHVGFGAGAAPAPQRFAIDRPHAFCIVHKPTRTPLFCGQVLDPR